jgi:hypothetical protein
MSWVEKIRTDFVITCGEGTSFTPLWLNATKKIEYNVAEFDFPNLAGTLVSRGKPRGTKYGLELFFQGDDHLDVSKSFETASADSRPWVISHPFYGNLTVQPTGLNIDNSDYNLTKITCTVIETITEDNPKTVIDPIENIALIKAQADELTLASFDAIPSAADKNSMTATNNKVYTDGKKITTLAEESESYFNAFNTANAAVLRATTEPLAAMRLVQSLINAPALFKNSVKTRVNTLRNQFLSMNESIAGATLRPTKKIYEANSVAAISSMALAAANPLEGDYQNRTDVLDIVDALVAVRYDSVSNTLVPVGAYPIFLASLDSLQTPNGGDLNSYVPNADTLSALNDIINFTVSSLFNIALGAKQERTYHCEDDTNIINLTHRFYGLDQGDENLAKMVQNNNIGLSEYFQLRKGRKIIYYV